MQEDERRDEADEKRPSETPTREQQAGEGDTTRFGMEEGDNTEVPATGGPDSWEEGD